MRRRRLLQSLTLAPAALAAPRPALADPTKILTFVPYADVAATDPIWSSSYATRTAALAVYDTLYGSDENLVAHPQMVAGHVVEQDGLLWRLTLREGLVFHDGERVLARDCVASIRRWGRRDAFGQQLLAATEELDAPDDRTIRFRLKRPFPLLPQALGRASSLIPVMMPERLARTDPFTQISEVVGSGPFRYVAAERVPGARHVFEKHAAYVPRPEGTPSQTAGPRIAHLDRVVFNVMPDPAAAAAALQAGEVDWVEQPLIDLLPRLRRSRDVVVEVKDRTGYMGHLRFNHLHPPFDNAAVRRVVLAAVSQQDCMSAVVGAEEALANSHVGAYAPISPMATDAGIPPRGPRDVAALRQQLAAAGYKGERVVMLGGMDVPRIAAVCEVTRDVMVRLGMNVDFVAGDWGTVTARINNREPVERGGWSAYCIYVGGIDAMSPAMHGMLRGSGTRGGPFGWPTSERMEYLRARFFTAPDEAAGRAIAHEMQAVMFEEAIYAPLGQFIQPVAYRRRLTGMLGGVPVFTNLRKA